MFSPHTQLALFPTTSPSDYHNRNLKFHFSVNDKILTDVFYSDSELTSNMQIIADGPLTYLLLSL